jgi:FAD/FMN-containing dehydrogenase
MAADGHGGDLYERLRQRLGPEALSNDPEHRALMSQDIWAKGTLADFVIAPDTTEALQETVRFAAENGINLNPRGAGMSYTSAYAPDRPRTAIVDFSRMNRIKEINTDDMYVTVEAGVTWSELHAALEKKGVRTPFWGPLSGLYATVGGGLSQNNALLGAGRYGTTADSVLSVAVVLGDGTLLRTGSAGATGAKPFWRYYGPDLTGLFCGDGGALGLKAEITLRLIPIPDALATASFEFADRDACAEAMTLMIRSNRACEMFSFDPVLTKVRMARNSFLEDASALANVIRKQGSWIKGIKEGAKIAMAGRGFMAEANFNLHVCVEGHSQKGVEEDLDVLREIAKSVKGWEIENSIPKIIRANPFGPLTSVLGPQGERWVPVHGIVPISEAAETWAEIDEMIKSLKSELDAQNVVTGYLTTTLGTTGYIVEPVFIWPEEIFPLHEQTVGKDVMRKMQKHDPNPDATALVIKVRQKVIDIITKRGGAHFQIGRAYPYAETRDEPTLALLNVLKQHLDGSGIINPGCLGLNRPEG